MLLDRIKNRLVNLNRSTVLLCVFLGLIVALFFFLAGYYLKSESPRSKFNLELQDLKYKFPNQNATLASELTIYQERFNLLTNPSDLDYSTLAELHIGSAKRNGSSTSYDTAEKLAQSSLKLNQRNKVAHVVLIKVLIARHQFQEALLKIDEIFGAEISAESAGLRSMVHLALGNYQRALVEINQLIKLKPDLGSATLKALALGHVGQDELAKHYFLRALQIEDLNEELQSTYTRGQLAQLLNKKGHYKQALALCDLALEISPKNPFIFFVKAESLIAQKDYHQARTLLQDAFIASKDPVYLLHMIFIAKILKKENDFKALSERALKIYETEVESNQYGHLADLASLYYVMGDFEKSHTLLQRNRKIRMTLKAEIALAKNLIQLKKPETAREIVEAQILIGATDVSLFYLMLDLLKGDHNENLRRIYQQKIKANNSRFNSDILMVIP